MLKFTISILILTFSTAQICQSEIYQLRVTTTHIEESGSSYLQRIAQKSSLDSQALGPIEGASMAIQSVNAAIAADQGYQFSYEQIITLEIIDQEIKRYKIEGVNPGISLSASPKGSPQVNRDNYVMLIFNGEQYYNKYSNAKTKFVDESIIDYYGENLTYSSEGKRRIKFIPLGMNFIAKYNHFLQLMKDKPEQSKETEEYIEYTLENRTTTKGLLRLLKVSKLNDWIKRERYVEGVLVNFEEFYCDDTNPLLPSGLITISSDRTYIYEVSSKVVSDDSIFKLPTIKKGAKS